MTDPSDALERRLASELPARLDAEVPRMDPRRTAEAAMAGRPSVRSGSAGVGVRPVLVAVAVVALVAGAVQLRSSVGPAQAPTPSALAGPRASIDAAGIPASVDGLTVISVPEAIAIRDSGSSERIAVGGWYEASAVPCPPRPDGAAFEDCFYDFSWLMARPEQLAQPNEVGPPSGPGVSVITDLGPNAGPQPVVFIGHFNDPAAQACPSGDRRVRCEQRFVVESVPWSAPIASVEPSPSPSPRPSPSPTAPWTGTIDEVGVAPSGAIWWISGRTLSISTDLGGTWHDALLPPFGPSNQAGPMFVLDATHAWSITETADSVDTGNGPTFDHAQLLVNHTTDAGSTWRSVAVPGDYPDTARSIVFIDAEHGFLMVSGGRTNQGSSTILRSDDGGATWTVVATVKAGSIGSLGSFLAVPDRSTLWAAAQEEAGPVDHPVLAVSRDGGRTWLDVTLPGMTATEGGTNIIPVAPPTFFDPEHGGFAVTTGDPAITGDPSGDPRTFIFTTSDGGRSWALRTRLSFDAQAVAFISATHWVASLNGLPATIEVTDDGGSSWSQVPTTNLPGGPILQLDRIDSVHALGYVLVGGNTGDPAALVISDDDGRTWRSVAAPTP